jgi:3-(3-hydroxy-phenyl)propionate hydroxylase
MAAAVTGEVSEIPPLPPIEGGLTHLSGGPVGHVFPQGTVVRGGRRGRFDDVVGAGWRLVTVDHAPLELDPGLARWFDGIGGAA